MINADGTVNLDPEGISMASGGGFWIASEGADTITDEGTTTSAVAKANLLLRVDAAGVIQQVVMLPSALDAVQLRFGFEGVAEADGKLVVAFQRAWNNEAHPRIGVYDLAAGTWQFVSYPLDPVASPNGGWVGLSDLAALGKVLVRDLMADLKVPGGSVPEKIEGLAVLPNREVVNDNDNDGVNDNSGETQLLRLGKILN